MIQTNEWTNKQTSKQTNILMNQQVFIQIKSELHKTFGKVFIEYLKMIQTHKQINRPTYKQFCESFLIFELVLLLSFFFSFTNFASISTPNFLGQIQSDLHKT